MAKHQISFGPGIAEVLTMKGKVRGYEYDGISIFKGIPYAKAKRFHAPSEVEPWKGVLDASSYGNVCPLMETPNVAGEVLIPHRYWPMDENCQNLNVWTPACDGQKRPVLVWLHGGGFSSGSAIEQLAYEGENMCREGQVVVVSVNHRLNVLGYFDLSDYGEEYANSANAGTDDLVAALKWVHENIGAFGGDPENVTLFGQSGGGCKVTSLLQTPAADGLYAKGIIISGVFSSMTSHEGSGKELAEAMMKKLRIKDVKKLETVPYEKLAAAFLKVSPKLRAAGKYVGNGPHKNAYFAGDPSVVGFRKETACVPLIVGSVFAEFSAFAPSIPRWENMTAEEGIAVVEKRYGKELAAELTEAFRAAYPDRNPVDVLLADTIFRGENIDYVRDRSALNDCTWSYLFDYDFPIDLGRPAWHCADIPYFFHNTELVPVTQDGEMTKKLEEEIFGFVMAFAHSGNPNHDRLPEWPASKPGEEETMIFGTDTKVRVNHDHALCGLIIEKVQPSFAKFMEEHKDEIQH